MGFSLSHQGAVLEGEAAFTEITFFAIAERN